MGPRGVQARVFCSPNGLDRCCLAPPDSGPLRNNPFQPVRDSLHFNKAEKKKRERKKRKEERRKRPTLTYSCIRNIVYTAYLVNWTDKTREEGGERRSISIDIVGITGEEMMSSLRPGLLRESKATSVVVIWEGYVI